MVSRHRTSHICIKIRSPRVSRFCGDQSNQCGPHFFLRDPRVFFRYRDQLNSFPLFHFTIPYPIQFLFPHILLSFSLFPFSLLPNFLSSIIPSPSDHASEIHDMDSGMNDPAVFPHITNWPAIEPPRPRESRINSVPQSGWWTPSPINLLFSPIFAAFFLFDHLFSRRVTPTYQRP